MTQCLLTSGAIPATSADTPHYPEETEQERRGSVVAGGGGHSVRAYFSLFAFRMMTSVAAKMTVDPTPHLFIYLFLYVPLLPGPDPRSVHMATRAGLGQARALARIGGATRTCKQRGCCATVSQPLRVGKINPPGEQTCLKSTRTYSLNFPAARCI